MSARLLEGRPLSERLRAEIRSGAKAVAEERGTPPRLAIVSIAQAGALEVYLRSKLRACRETGIEATVQALPHSASEAEVLRLLEDLGRDAVMDGVLLELPLPPGLDLRRVLDALDPRQDVEGVTSRNAGLLYGAKTLPELEAAAVPLPCTAEAVIRLLQDAGVPLSGREAVVVGRSQIVGRPVAHLLSCLNATVTLCHSKTEDLPAHLGRADIVVSATGKAGYLKGEWLKAGAAVVDVGIDASGGAVRGDVDFESARARAGCITPVPGGIGPLTVTCLLRNVLRAAQRSVRGL